VVKALRHGGCVLVMRHASAPRSRREARAAETDNISHRPHLDDNGKTTARGMGEAIRQLRIPVDKVFSSPADRALETVRLAGFLQPHIVAQLGEPTAEPSWLHAKITQPPLPGTNILIVTHLPNILDIFIATVAPGEVLVFRPDGTGAVELLTRVEIEHWSQLAECFREPPAPDHITEPTAS